MARFEVGDLVRVDMPKGVNKRGVVGISVLYTTWPEARFDGAVGDVVEINPRGPYGIPLYLVNFKGQDRKSTRLNSSHANISYAVFCLKKKQREPCSPGFVHELRRTPRLPPRAHSSLAPRRRAWSSRPSRCHPRAASRPGLRSRSPTPYLRARVC